MRSIKQKAAQTAKRAGMMSAGLVFCTVALGFLTGAAWLQLVLYVTPTLAALILGAVYLVFGLAFIAIGRSTPDTPQVAADIQHAAPPPSAPPLVQAFLHGLEAGSRASNKNS